MNQNLLSLTTLVVIFFAYIVVRKFILKKKINQDNNPKSAKMNLVAKIVHIIAIIGLLIFFWIGLIQRWNDGIHNYFNLILLVILTVLSFIRFWKQFNRNN